MARFRIDGAWGFIDKFGKLAGAPPFDHADDFSEGLAAVKLGEHWGFVDKTGELVIPPRFGSVHRFSAGLAAAMGEGGNWGYIDRHGQWVIAPAYEQAGRFQDRTAMVRERRQGSLLIDRRGQVVKRFEAGLSVDLDPDARGLYRAERQGARWLWHREGGLFPMPEALQRYVQIDGDGLIPVSLESNGGDVLWGAMDIQGRWAVPARFASIGPFQAGLAVAQPAEPAGGDVEGGSLAGRRLGLIDRQGRFVVPPQYERITRQAWGGYQATHAGEAGSDIIGRDGRVLLAAATCPGLREVLVALSVEKAQWSVVAGCGRSWAFHARAGMVRSRIAKPAAYATGTHLMLEGALSGTQAPLPFDIFDAAGRRVVSSEDRALQGDQALTRGDLVLLVPSGEATAEHSRLDLLPLAVVVRKRNETQIITRDGKLISNPGWHYRAEMNQGHFVLSGPGGPGGKPLDGPLVMSTPGEPFDEPSVWLFSGDAPPDRTRWGAIDGRGRWVVQPQHGHYLSSFRDGAVVDWDGTQPMVVERDGKRHLWPQDVQRITRVSQRAFIGSPRDPGDPLVRLELGTGNITRITFPAKVNLEDFHDGLVSAGDPEGLRWGLLDDQGEWAVPPRFDRRLDPVRDVQGRLLGWRSASRFFDGDSSRLRLGWLDAEGRELVAPGYSAIEYDAKHGMLLLTKDEEYKGLMAPDGQVLLPVQYEDIRQLGEIFVVKEPTQYGLLDARGEWSAPLAPPVRPRGGWPVP